MEESMNALHENPNTSSLMIKKTSHTTKEHALLNSSSKPKPIASFSSTNIYEDKLFKPILLHKRRLSNNNTLGLQNSQNASTDNQDDNITISKNIFKKLQNSYILKDFEVIYGFFPFEVEFRLVFRASDHHFSVQKFHELCDYETNTLTICKTKSNQIIGGYTPLPWAQNFEENKTFYKTDKQNETFLFNYNKNEKYPLEKAKKNKAICCFRNYGPTFGGGCDLQIGNRADQIYSSASYFPRSFTCETKMVTQKHLTGSKNKQFKILQWEVYKVIKKRNSKIQSIEELKTQGKQQSFIQTIKKGLTGIFFAKDSK